MFKRQNRNDPSSIDDGEVTNNPDTDVEVSLLRDAALDASVPAGLRVVNLRKTFKHDCIAVNDSSFVMHYGELLAVLGANGSGKSTTCHVLCGITPATAGDALLDDKASLLDRRHGGGLIGWCPQHDILFDQLTALEHVSPFYISLMADFTVRCDLWGDKRCSYYGRGTIEKSKTMASEGRPSWRILGWNEETIKHVIVYCW